MQELAAIEAAERDSRPWRKRQTVSEPEIPDEPNVPRPAHSKHHPNSWEWVAGVGWKVRTARGSKKPGGQANQARRKLLAASDECLEAIKAITSGDYTDEDEALVLKALGAAALAGLKG